MIPSEAKNQSDKLTYDYVESSDGYESGRVSQVVSEIRKSSSTSVISTTTNNYTYDANGNITQITNASGVIQNKYYYDDLNQLTREDNRALNHSYTYTYDNAGNITAKKIYAFTTGTLGSVQETVSYTYGDSSWRDLLTNYNGTAITYDTIGNPTQMGDIYLTWQGRQLTQYHDDFYYVTTSYTYNADGIRTSKSVDEFGDVREYVYILSGDTVIGEQVYYCDFPEYSLVYLYDETGSPIGLKYRYDEPGAAYSVGVYDCYFFEKNLQGDIIGIYDRYGTKVVTYTYDAWGNMTVSGRQMKMYTDQPCVQFYSGNFLTNEKYPFKNGCPQRPQMALCLETQKMPDSINHENFTSVVLDVGETYTHKTVYEFSVI